MAEFAACLATADWQGADSDDNVTGSINGRAYGFAAYPIIDVMSMKKAISVRSTGTGGSGSFKIARYPIPADKKMWMIDREGGCCEPTPSSRSG